jgi:hypothetical protein
MTIRQPIYLSSPLINNGTVHVAWTSEAGPSPWTRVDAAGPNNGLMLDTTSYLMSAGQVDIQPDLPPDTGFTVTNKTGASIAYVPSLMAVFDELRRLSDVNRDIFTGSIDYRSVANSFGVFMNSHSPELHLTSGVALAQGTITLPVAPYDSMEVLITADHDVATLNIAAGPGHSITGSVVSKIDENNPVRFKFRAFNGQWRKTLHDAQAAAPVAEAAAHKKAAK